MKWSTLNTINIATGCSTHAFNGADNASHMLQQMHAPKPTALSSIVMSMLCPLLAVEKVLRASSILGFSCQDSGPTSHQHSQEKQWTQGSGETGIRGHRDQGTQGAHRVAMAAAPTASSAHPCVGSLSATMAGHFGGHWGSG